MNVNIDFIQHPELLKPPPLNPWQRLRNYEMDIDPFAEVREWDYVDNSGKNKFGNYVLDHNTKNAVFQVSPSVVGLSSSSGGEQVFWGSGIIFESSPKKNGSFYYLVLTSATLLRPPRRDPRDNRPWRKKTERYVIKAEDEGFVPIDETIDVYILGFGLHKGTVVTSDFHFNIAVLKFKSDYQLPPAVLRPLDDSFEFCKPINSKGCTSKFDSRLRLIPGDKVIVVGRYTENPFEIMAIPGRYSSKNFGKMELLRANCKITKCGIGGPLISCKGEVIGINFYAEDCTPFLPINIFLLWWSYFNDTRRSRRPWMGMEVANHFYTSKLDFCERLLNLGISQGVRVKKFSPRSPAKISGLRPGDVIIKCNGRTVTSPLQLFELIWDMAGKVVKVAVVRKGYFQNVNIKIKDIKSANGFYQWRLRGNI